MTFPSQYSGQYRSTTRTCLLLKGKSQEIEFRWFSGRPCRLHSCRPQACRSSVLFPLPEPKEHFSGHWQVIGKGQRSWCWATELPTTILRRPLWIELSDAERCKRSTTFTYIYIYIFNYTYIIYPYDIVTPSGFSTGELYIRIHHAHIARKDPQRLVESHRFIEFLQCDQLFRVIR